MRRRYQISAAGQKFPLEAIREPKLCPPAPHPSSLGPFNPGAIPGTSVTIGGSIPPPRFVRHQHTSPRHRLQIGQTTGPKEGADPKCGDRNPQTDAALMPMLCGLWWPGLTMLKPDYSTQKGMTADFMFSQTRPMCWKRCNGFVGAAQRHVIAGSRLPGARRADSFNDLAFALPGGAKESYFELKLPLIAARLDDLSPLWETE